MSTAVASAVVDRRYDFLLFFDVQDGNPNGDPDAGNMPRIDPETNQGIVSDVCLKRKIRNAISTRTRDASGADQPGFEVYFQHQGVLNRQHERAFKALGLDAKGKTQEATSEKTRRWMCENFCDVRMFGAVMTTGVNCGQVRGPVQLTFARSVDAVLPFELTITRKSVTTEEDAKKQLDKDGYITGTMGRKYAIPYGLYLGHGFVSPPFAADTGFTYTDLDLLFEALLNMFEIDRSSSRGLMAMRKVHVFQHDSPLGRAPAHVLFERVKSRIQRKGGVKVARSFQDYEVPDLSLLRVELPAGVRLRELVEEGLAPAPWEG